MEIKRMPMHTLAGHQRQAIREQKKEYYRAAASIAITRGQRNDFEARFGVAEWGEGMVYVVFKTGEVEDNSETMVPEIDLDKDQIKSFFATFHPEVT